MHDTYNVKLNKSVLASKIYVCRPQPKQLPAHHIGALLLLRVLNCFAGHI